MFTDKLYVEPNIIEHAVYDDGAGQKRDGLLAFLDAVIQSYGSDDRHDHQDRYPAVPPSGAPESSKRLCEEARQQDYACYEAGISERTGVIIVPLIYPKADRGKQRGQIDRCVEARQHPPVPAFPPGLNDIQEQDQDDWANGISIDGYDRPEHGLRLPDGQGIIPIILRDQRQAQGCDDQHGPSIFPPDIGIDQHDERKTQQQQQQRKQHSQRADIHGHTLTSFPASCFLTIVSE